MTLFLFVVRHLRWLARMPGLPHLFDTALLAWTAAFHRPRLAAMETVERAALEIPGTRLGVHGLGGIGFVREGREFAHLHGNGLLDLLIGRRERDRLVEANIAQPHHVLPDSAWVSFWIRGPSDVEQGRALLAAAADRPQKPGCEFRLDGQTRIHEKARS